MALSINHILKMSLFTGLTQKELLEISDTTHFSLSHIKKGGVIADEESPCTQLSFIVQGWFEMTTLSDDKTYSMTEVMQAFHVIEPDKLFGLHQRHHAQYVALTPCEVISIDKETLHMLLSRYLIVRLNFLNMLCRRSQILEHSYWRVSSDDITYRIRQFFLRHTVYPAGKKILHITMNQLAKELHDSRLDVSVALNKLADKERIILKRGIIEVPALQLL